MREVRARVGGLGVGLVLVATACGPTTPSAWETCARNPDLPACDALTAGTQGTAGSGGAGSAAGSGGAGATVPGEMCPRGTADCDGDPGNGCEANLQSDLLHCGSCGVSCARSNVDARCEAGNCVVGACTEGWGDCDANPGNGCETPLRTLTDCGACGTPCTNPNANVTCARGHCEVSQCQPGHEECDGNPATVCETALSTLTDCGGCRIACAPQNVLDANCATATCNWNQCQAGWADCDRDRLNGCENALSSAMDCGACGMRCQPPADPKALASLAPSYPMACVQAQCKANCADGYVDGNGQPFDGCEIDLNRDPQNCGKVNHGCAMPTCEGGVCVADARIAAGAKFTCAIRTDGKVGCWGTEALGNRQMQSSLSPVEVSGLTDARALGSGPGQACAIVQGGRVYCWGYNQYGQVGSVPGIYVTYPFEVELPAPALQVSGDHETTCALLADARLWCWGFVSTVVAPMPPLLLAGVAEVSGGAAHGCARLLGDGDVMCWKGLPNRPPSESTPPTLKVGATGKLTRVLGLSVGPGDPRCARLQESLLCWGKIGSSAWSGPTNATGLRSTLWVSAGGAHVCAVDDASAVHCWGGNAQGQIGDGSRTEARAAKRIPALDAAANRVAQIAAGSEHTCALLSNGKVRCWGANASGQLGYGDTRPRLEPGPAFSP